MRVLSERRSAGTTRRSAFAKSDAAIRASTDDDDDDDDEGRVDVDVEAGAAGVVVVVVGGRGAFAEL